MLAKRIIPCLDVKNGQVVKGVRFRDHEVVGDIVVLAQRYSEEGADELVFYDITASSDFRSIEVEWVTRVAKVIDIPFCVAGGIRSLDQARAILNAGADKISINSPALERPEFISELADVFGQQCVVVGVDSLQHGEDYFVYQYTGNVSKTIATSFHTMDWIQQVQELGAGEIVLNCMDQDGVRQGYDNQQLQQARARLTIPLIASGGAGIQQHFADVFKQVNVDGALAASVFHKGLLKIDELKKFLKQQRVEVRI